MSGELGDEGGVTPLERLGSGERAHPRPPVFAASTRCRGGLIYSVGGGIGDGLVFVKFGCALGCVESCRSSLPDDARVARCAEMLGR